jgi:2-phosphosulfolactate phosphatase
MIYDQAEFEIRCEWGLQGVEILSPISDVVIIVDVFSFSTSVEIATSRGALVYPFRGSGDATQEFAASLGAYLAGDNAYSYSLSPSSLVEIPGGTRLVLPSPNGSLLSMSTGTAVTLAGCLRNAGAVAHAARRYGKRIAVIPAGERWRDGSLRPALEDWLGAGAILRHLQGNLSPEAQAAVASFKDAQSDLLQHLERCSSGKEKHAREEAGDIALAGALDVSQGVPMLREGAYQLLEGTSYEPDSRNG